MDVTPSTSPYVSLTECAELVAAAVDRLQGVIDEYQHLTVEEFNDLDDPLDVTPVQETVQADLQAAVDRGCPPDLLQQQYEGAIAELQGTGVVGQSVAAALRGEGPPAGPLPPILVSPPTLPSAECQAAVDEAVDRLQAHVDAFGDLTVEEYLALDPPPDVTPILEQIQEDLQAMANAGCDADELNAAFDARVQGLKGEGPVGAALAAGLRGDDPPAIETPAPAAPAPEGPAGVIPLPVTPPPPPPPPPPPVPTTVVPRVGDDLRVLVASLAPGSRLDLPAGTFRVSEPIVIDKTLTITGSGRNSTVIESSAPGAAIVFLGPGDLAVSGLSLRHTGAANASLLLAIEGAVTISGVGFSGARGSLAEGSGSGLVFGFEPIEGFPARTAASRAGALTISDSVFTGNAGAGMMVIGGASPVVTGSEFRGNGTCGVCLVSTASGTVRSSTFNDNGTGVQADGRADLTVTDSRFGAHGVAAVVLTQSATGTITGNTVAGGGIAGMQFLGEATARVSGNRLSGSSTVCLSAIGSTSVTMTRNTTTDCRIGIQVAMSARPTITLNTVASSAEVGIYVGDDAGGLVRGNNVSGNGDVGIQVTDRATPTVESNRLTGSGRVGVVYWSSSGGTFGANTVSGFGVGMQVGEDAVPSVVGNTFSGSTEATLLATGRTTAVIRNNDVGGAGPIGVQVAVSAAPTIDANRITGAYTVALLYLGASQGTATANQIQGAASGVQLGGTASPSLLGNRISQSRVASIHYFETSGGQARDNICQPAEGGGIVLATGGAPSLGSNQCSISSSG